MPDEYADSAVDSSSARTRSVAWRRAGTQQQRRVFYRLFSSHGVLDSLHFELITGR